MRPWPPSPASWLKTQRATMRPANSKPVAARSSRKGRRSDMTETPEIGGRGARPGVGREPSWLFAPLAERQPRADTWRVPIPHFRLTPLANRNVSGHFQRKRRDRRRHARCRRYNPRDPWHIRLAMLHVALLEPE